MHLLDLLWHCIYKDFGAQHLFITPQSARLDDSVGQGEIFVENKLFQGKKGAEHRNIK